MPSHWSLCSLFLNIWHKINISIFILSFISDASCQLYAKFHIPFHEQFQWICLLFRHVPKCTSKHTAILPASISPVVTEIDPPSHNLTGKFMYPCWLQTVNQLILKVPAWLNEREPISCFSHTIFKVQGVCLFFIRVLKCMSTVNKKYNEYLHARMQ